MPARATKAKAAKARTPESTTCSETTVKGRPCKGPPMLGTDPPMCVAHLGKNGRKTTLTTEVTQKLVELLAGGNYVAVALAVTGVARATFYVWIERGDPEGSAARDLPYREFREQIEQARAEGEAKNVSIVAKAAKEDWKAAAWMLERQFPDRWARSPAKDRSDGDKVPKPSADAGQAEEQDPFRALEGDELAQRRVQRGAS